MNRHLIDSRLPLIQDADLAGKVVLVRVDHNVVKKGVIHDPYRIDATLGTLYNIVERGGRPILMTHVGPPQGQEDRDHQGGRRHIGPAHRGIPGAQAVHYLRHSRVSRGRGTRASAR